MTNEHMELEIRNNDNFWTYIQSKLLKSTNDSLADLSSKFNNFEKENNELKLKRSELEAALEASRRSTSSKLFPEGTGALSSNKEKPESFPGKEDMEKSLQRLEKDLEEARREEDKARQELKRLKETLPDSILIEELCQNNEIQRFQILGLEKTLEQAMANQDVIKSSYDHEIRKWKGIIEDLNQKLSNCLRTIDSKNVELVNLQTALGESSGTAQDVAAATTAPSQGAPLLPSRQNTPVTETDDSNSSQGDILINTNDLKPPEVDKADSKNVELVNLQTALGESSGTAQDVAAATTAPSQGAPLLPSRQNTPVTETDDSNSSQGDILINTNDLKPPEVDKADSKNVELVNLQTALGESSGTAQDVAAATTAPSQGAPLLPSRQNTPVTETDDSNSSQGDILINTNDLKPPEVDKADSKNVELVNLQTALGESSGTAQDVAAATTAPSQGAPLLPSRQNTPVTETDDSNSSQGDILINTNDLKPPEVDKADSKNVELVNLQTALGESSGTAQDVAAATTAPSQGAPLLPSRQNTPVTETDDSNSSQGDILINTNDLKPPEVDKADSKNVELVNLQTALGESSGTAQDVAAATTAPSQGAPLLPSRQNTPVTETDDSNSSQGDILINTNDLKPPEVDKADVRQADGTPPCLVFYAEGTETDDSNSSQEDSLIDTNDQFSQRDGAEADVRQADGTPPCSVLDNSVLQADGIPDSEQKNTVQEDPAKSALAMANQEEIKSSNDPEIRKSKGDLSLVYEEGESSGEAPVGLAIAQPAQPVKGVDEVTAQRPFDYKRLQEVCGKKGKKKGKKVEQPIEPERAERLLLIEADRRREIGIQNRAARLHAGELEKGAKGAKR